MRIIERIDRETISRPRVSHERWRQVTVPQLIGHVGGLIMVQQVIFAARHSRDAAQEMTRAQACAQLRKIGRAEPFLATLVQAPFDETGIVTVEIPYEHLHLRAGVTPVAIGQSEFVTPSLFEFHVPATT
jgi:hypothetical protein